MVCGKKVTNSETGKHTEDTGHNEWELLIPWTKYLWEMCRGMFVR